ncbi:MAG TPA: transglutaminase family protein [Gemmatimonadaceae bacterium]|nr:transglutaminase family protein [Gemmatimonadaceae bacterium]
MKIRLVHVTRFDYSADVVEGVMEVRLGPLTDATQRWDRFTLGVSPSGSVRQFVDGFGNRTHLVTVGKPHRTLEVVTRSELSTTLENPFAPPGKAPRPLSPSEQIDYLSPSPLVPALREFREMVAAHGWRTEEPTFERVRTLSRLVHESFTYQRNVTTVGTTVAEVMRLRSGVCQDFAHVLIGLCRAAGVPARYVSGYTVADLPEGDGGRREQASHAWVEAYTTTHGWRGLDATNDVVVGDAHVKIAIGRDYADVSPTRGSFRGNAAQRLGVTVEAYRVD